MPIVRRTCGGRAGRTSGSEMHVDTHAAAAVIVIIIPLAFCLFSELGSCFDASGKTTKTKFAPPFCPVQRFFFSIFLVRLFLRLIRSVSTFEIANTVVRSTKSKHQHAEYTRDTIARQDADDDDDDGADAKTLFSWVVCLYLLFLH